MLPSVKEFGIAFIPEDEANFPLVAVIEVLPERERIWGPVATFKLTASYGDLEGA